MSIKIVEKSLYEFLCEEFKNSEYQIFRGSLPVRKYGAVDKNTGLKKAFFPCMTLRVLDFTQTRDGIDVYNCDATFEIIIGTKNENYIDNLAKGDELRGKLLGKLWDKRGMAIRQDREFKCEYYSDEFGDFIFSRIIFTVYAYPVEPIKE